MTSHYQVMVGVNPGVNGDQSVSGNERGKARCER